MQTMKLNTDRLVLSRTRKRFFSGLLIGIMSMLLIQCSSGDAGYDWLKEDAVAGNPPTTTITDDFSLTISDVTGSTDFIFEALQTVDLYTIVLDANSPASGSTVQIREMSGDRTGRVVFRAVADAEGLVKGSFTINTSSPTVLLEFSFNGNDYTFEIDVTNVLQINRTLYLNSTATPVTIVDADGDGVADADDHFPNDPKRATSVRYPAEGSYTIAFEDLYPKKGDADFNDYVFSMFHVEELDAQGRVVTLRGNYTHIAKGAGYNHTLNIRLPNTENAVFTRVQKAANGTVKVSDNRILGLNEDIELLGNSKNTISQSNTAAGQTFKPGDNIDFSVDFASAVNRSDLGNAPYDIYLYVMNTKNEIHFAGRYHKADGSDLYLDSDGFPWALLVPADWRWMLETKNVHDAYPRFQGWYSSFGVNDKDWYSEFVASLVMAR